MSRSDVADGTGVARRPAVHAARRVGSVLCGLVAAYFLLVAAYAVLNAGAFASDLPRVLRYVLAPLAIGGLLLAAAVRLPAERRLMTGISAATLLATLFAFEALLTARSFAGIDGLFGQLRDPAQATRFQEAIPPTYTLKGLNNALGVTEPREAILAGMPGAEVLLCDRNDAPVSYVADAHGLRNPPHVSDAPVEVLVLGDSFAEGICLPDGEDLASRLRDRVPGTLNTGTRGSGPLFQLALLHRWGPALRPPETVVLFFEGNDWENLEHELGLPYLRPFLDAGVDPGPLLPDSATLAAARQVIETWWAEHGRARHDPSRHWLRNFAALHQTSAVLGLHYPGGPKDQPEYERILRTSRDLTAGWGGRVTVVYIPRIDRFVGLLPNAFAFDGLRDRVRAAAESAEVGFVDLTVPMMQASAPMALYAPDSHLSAEGALFAALIIVEHLQTGE